MTPWTAACQAPLPMEFSRQEYWSRLPFPSLGDFPDPGIKLASPALAGDSLPLHHLGSPSKLQTNKNPRRQRTMHILEKQTRKMPYVPKEIEPQRHPVCVCSVTWSCPTLCAFMNCGSCVHGIFQDKNTEVGCHFLLQGIFLTLRSNLHFLQWQSNSLLPSHLGSPCNSIPPAFCSLLVLIKLYYQCTYLSSQLAICSLRAMILPYLFLYARYLNSKRVSAFQFLKNIYLFGCTMY